MALKKQDLVKKCWKQEYLKKKKVELMYATTDGNLFNEKHFASSHAQALKTEVITITIDDIKEISWLWKFRVRVGHFLSLCSRIAYVIWNTIIPKTAGSILRTLLLSIIAMIIATIIGYWLMRMLGWV